jgi:hypothetical protein
MKSNGSHHHQFQETVAFIKPSREIHICDVHQINEFDALRNSHIFIKEIKLYFPVSIGYQTIYKLV